MDVKRWIGNLVRGKIWRDPIVSFCSAESTEILPRIIPNHLTAEEILPHAKGVIVYFIPFTRWVVGSNVEGERPSKLWAYAYLKTNKMIREINKLISRKLENLGFKCFATEPTHDFDEINLMSRWSHKHLAYLSGLGTFGLHTMIITESGCCGRLGSLITTAEFDWGEPLKEEFCLFKRGIECRKCVERCFKGALNNGFDRKKCYSTLLENSKLFEFFADVCGKCACGVPCSLEKPV
ncbi:MAG: epoxyqueuosine reductase [Archaeoglobales archaeon]|nr:MAG: epoxyqueuosine reductase [Archaeoglobales archaeon]